MQKLPIGELVPIGTAGTLSVSFVSDGKIADVEASIVKARVEKEVQTVEPATIIKRLESGSAWTRASNPLERLTIKDLKIVYPISNITGRMDGLCLFSNCAQKEKMTVTLSFT